MSEIADRAEKKAIEILHNQWKLPESTAGIIFRQLLKIPEIAIVDREAEQDVFLATPICGGEWKKASELGWLKEVK